MCTGTSSVNRERRSFYLHASFPCRRQRERDLHVFGQLDEFIHRNSLFFTREIVVLRQEQHAMALLSLTHRHARAVPEPIRHLGFLIVVVPARAQRRAERILVLRQTLNYHRRHALIHAKIRPTPTRVLFRKLTHHFQILLRRCARASTRERRHVPVSQSFRVFARDAASRAPSRVARDASTTVSIASSPSTSSRRRRRYRLCESKTKALSRDRGYPSRRTFSARDDDARRRSPSRDAARAVRCGRLRRAMVRGAVRRASRERGGRHRVKTDDVAQVSLRATGGEVARADGMNAYANARVNITRKG